MLKMFVFRVCLDTSSPRADLIILVIIRVITTPDSCFLFCGVKRLFYVILPVSVEPMAVERTDVRITKRSDTVVRGEIIY